MWATPPPPTPKSKWVALPLSWFYLSTIFLATVLCASKGILGLHVQKRSFCNYMSLNWNLNPGWLKILAITNRNLWCTLYISIQFCIWRRISHADFPESKVILWSWIQSYTIKDTAAVNCQIVSPRLALLCLDIRAQLFFDSGRLIPSRQCRQWHNNLGWLQIVNDCLVSQGQRIHSKNKLPKRNLLIF